MNFVEGRMQAAAGPGGTALLVSDLHERGLDKLVVVWGDRLHLGVNKSGPRSLAAGVVRSRWPHGGMHRASDRRKRTA